VIVGQGKLVGKPLVDYLEKRGEKVIRCDEFTKDLKAKTLQADVLVTATGVANLIKKDMIKEGIVIIDCGSPKPEVDVEVYKIAGAYTPVPGGVGPLTVVCLLENLIEAVKVVV
jgi:methylenetetrahydrofolate dehydrogenase (NADP+)/methenyltetrahydrofolate cyclohydrolase